MASSLSAGFLTVPTFNSDVADKIWLNSNISEIKNPVASISLDTARTILKNLSGAETEIFASVITTRATLETLLQENSKNVRFRLGAVVNPNLSLATLTSLAFTDADNDVKTLGKQRVSAMTEFLSAARTGKNKKMMSAFATLTELNISGPLADLLVSNDADLAKTALSSIEPVIVDEEEGLDADNRKIYHANLAFRGRTLEVLKDIDPEVYDYFMATLVGAVDDTFKAAWVDLYIAEWLSSSTSEYAEMSRHILIPERGARFSEEAVDLSKRLEYEARERFKKHDTLWDIVAHKTVGGGYEANRYESAGAEISYSYLTAMKMAIGNGMLGMLFGSNCELNHEELKELLDEATPQELVPLFLHESERFIHPGDTTAILENFDWDERKELRKAIDARDEERKGALKNMPWRVELVTGLPKWRKLEFSTAEFTEMKNTIDAELMEDATRWDALLKQLDKQKGSLKDLIASV